SRTTSRDLGGHRHIPAPADRAGRAGENVGMAVSSLMVPLGTPAPDFALPPADGGELVSLGDFADAPALLVAFLCNHCPYVRHAESALGQVPGEYAPRGLATIGISCNDVRSYPDDAPEHMVEQARRA